VEDVIDILGLSSSELAEQAKSLLPSGAGVAGKIYERAFAKGELDPQGLGLSSASEAAWRKSFSVRLLKPIRVVQEEYEKGAGEEEKRVTAKAVLGLADGCEIECVRIPMLGGDGAKSTLCISSQVGCRMGCAFCETGRSGLSRNLAAGEIIAQVLTARIELGWDCGNIVFMGMGECLDNLAEVSRALSILADRRGLGFAQERITICTSGPPGGIEALRSLGLKRLGLSISLNAANDDKRGTLMPINKANDLEALAASLAAYPLRSNFALGVNWCLMPGINDSREDAAEAAAFCAKLGRCVVNLIPYNPGSSPLARTPTETEMATFAAWLTGYGCLVKRRSSKGSLIMAGCGQLGGHGLPRG
jgi:23S rRNA (adenine2503-C2)-methyltransferase